MSQRVKLWAGSITTHPPFDIQQEVKEKYDSSEGQSTGIPGDPILINQTISEYLYKQLSVEFLNKVDQLLPAAEEPRLEHDTPLYRLGPQELRLAPLPKQKYNTRPLHRQLEMRREIIITEDPCLHLLIETRKFFLKPLPLYLLKWQFFKDNICPDNELYKYAAGFLYTYTCLIKHPSDFRIALDYGLIPNEVTWKEWSSLATKLAGMRQGQMNKRWRHGELHLRRINGIFVLQHGYMPYELFPQQEDLMTTRYFKPLVLVLAVLLVVLGALQVILATGNGITVFNVVSRYIGSFSLVAAVASVAVMHSYFSITAP